MGYHTITEVEKRTRTKTRVSVQARRTTLAVSFGGKCFSASWSAATDKWKSLPAMNVTNANTFSDEEAVKLVSAIFDAAEATQEPK